MKDRFSLSYGNLIVLKTIPDMMRDKKYRNKLRYLTIEFLNMRNKK